MAFFTNLTRANEIGANSYLLEIAGAKLLLDAGHHPTIEGPPGLPRLDLIEPGTLDGIFITHAHHDHIGALPVVQRHQPQAPVIMTGATAELSDTILHNSVNVMERRREADGPLPHFFHGDVSRCAKMWRSCVLQFPRDIARDVQFSLYHAGHVLGSVGVLIEAEGRCVFYTGDVNFEDQSVMCGAQFPDGPLDVLVVETTRGDKAALPGFTRESEVQRFSAAISQVFSQGGGVLLPVFALGKTQELLAVLRLLRKTGPLTPATPLYVSGLADGITKSYDRYAKDLPRLIPPTRKLRDDDTQFVLSQANFDDAPFKGRRIYAVSSGMMSPETISWRLAQEILESPQHAIFFVGYCDPESVAGKIRAAAPGEKVTFENGNKRKVRCRVESFNFTGHASRESILAYILRTKPRKVILVHGEGPALDWYRAELAIALPGTEVIVPEPGRRIEV